MKTYSLEDLTINILARKEQKNVTSLKLNFALTC